MIWIIGGTTEARIAEAKLLGKKDLIITVATQEGKEFLQSENIFVGRLSETDMKTFMLKNKVDTVLDCSHPYALEVSKNAKKACETLKVKYIRIKRPEVKSDESCESFYSLDELLLRLEELSGCFLITLGSKNISDLVSVRKNNRFIFRVLPTVESISLLHEHGVVMKDIIACLGPFSKEQNLLTIKENGVDYLVTKESGKAGGEEAKLQAAKEGGAKILLLKRKPEAGETLESVLQKLVE